MSKCKKRRNSSEQTFIQGHQNNSLGRGADVMNLGMNVANCDSSRQSIATFANIRSCRFLSRTRRRCIFASRICHVNVYENSSGAIVTRRRVALGAREKVFSFQKLGTHARIIVVRSSAKSSQISTMGEGGHTSPPYAIIVHWPAAAMIEYVICARNGSPRFGGKVWPALPRQFVSRARNDEARLT